VAGEFVNRPAVSNEGPRRWKLLAPLMFKRPDGTITSVPSGFECDGASIPWFLMSFTPSKPKVFRAAIFHDYNYWTQLSTRFMADAEFYEMMRLEKVNPVSASIYYYAVRLVGWYPWWKNGRAKRAKT
jgi:hypothetical protein